MSRFALGAAGIVGSNRKTRLDRIRAIGVSRFPQKTIRKFAEHLFYKSPLTAGRYSMESGMVPDETGRMMQMVTGNWITQIVHAAATFSLAEHLAKGPATAIEIAGMAKTDPGATFRFLRACASIGLVEHDGDARFSTTALLNTLRKDDPRGLRGLALTFAAPGHWLPWGRFTEAVKTGQSQAVPALGMQVWDYFSTHPEEAEAFTSALASDTAGIVEEVARSVDVGTVSIAADIGGAGGQLLHGLLRRNPDLRGIAFDLPHVVASATAAARDAGFEDRVTSVGGDFLQSVPEADLYLLKRILHDWNDEDCIRILRNCRRAIRPGGRLVAIDMLIGKIGEPGPAALIDLTMMVVTVSGRERTLAEFQALLEETGFRITRVSPTMTPASIIEAAAV